MPSVTDARAAVVGANPLLSSRSGIRRTDGHETPTEEFRISDPRTNDRIRVPEVRLVGPNGEQVGVVAIDVAIRLAQEADLDLVEVAPNSKPPVAKIMDFGKFKYETAQKAKEAKRNQTNTILKEVRFRLKIDVHDYETKRKRAEGFLQGGDKVKAMILFRGREQSRPEQGVRLLQRFAEDVADFGTVESTPTIDGRNMVMVIGPLKTKAEVKAEHDAKRPVRPPRPERSAEDEAADDVEDVDVVETPAPAKAAPVATAPVAAAEPAKAPAAKAEPARAEPAKSEPAAEPATAKAAPAKATVAPKAEPAKAAPAASAPEPAAAAAPKSSPVAPAVKAATAATPAAAASAPKPATAAKPAVAPKPAAAPKPGAPKPSAGPRPAPTPKPKA